MFKKKPQKERVVIQPQKSYVISIFAPQSDEDRENKEPKELLKEVIYRTRGGVTSCINYAHRLLCLQSDNQIIVTTK